MSLRERLFMLVDFVGMNLRVLLLPPPSCFLNVFLPTLVTADFKFFFPLITSAILGTAYSNKSAPTLRAAGTINYLTKGTAVLLIT